MNIDISDLEQFVHTHNPLIRVNEQGCDLLLSYKAVNYRISHVVDTENDLAFVHLAKSFYFIHGRIKILEPYDDDRQPLTPITIKLPENIRRVVVGEDYYFSEGIVVNEGDASYFIDGYDQNDQQRTQLLSPCDAVKITDIIAKIPDIKLPVTSSPVKSGIVIFRDFPVLWPGEKLIVEEIEYLDDRGEVRYSNLRNECLNMKKF